MKDNNVLPIVFAAGLGLGWVLKDCLTNLQKLAELEMYVQDHEHKAAIELARSASVSSSNNSDTPPRCTKS